MPLYDYRCSKCRHEFEQIAKINDRLDVKCPKCQSKCNILITGAKRDWFRAGYWEDFDEQPIYVESKGQLKQLCKKYGVYSRALD